VEANVDLGPWLALLRELGFTAVAGFLIWCLVRLIWWLLQRNSTLSDTLLKVVERNSEALERLRHTLEVRPCLKNGEEEKTHARDERDRDRH
jgi:hypothetical protein